MRVISVFLLFSLHFSIYAFNSEYLKPVSFSYSVKFNLNGYYSQNLIQIFSPFNRIDVITSNTNFQNVMQAGFILPMNESVSISTKGYKSITVWYRIINAVEIKRYYPIPSNVNLNFQISRASDVSYFPIKFNYNWGSSNSISYQLWVVPIFPSGQFLSWSSDYSTRTSSRIISTLNSSIDDDYLKNNGVLLVNNSIKKIDEPINLTNRSLYTYLIILQIKFNEKIKLQLNPAIIYGCLSKSLFSSTDYCYSDNIQDGNNSCRPKLSQVWFNITCAALAFLILFILCGSISENTQIFYSSWLITAYFSCVCYHYLIGNLYESDIYLYVILFAIGLGCAIALTVISRKSCKQGNSLRMLFNACSIILIILSIVFFGIENQFPKEIYVYIGIGVISSLLLIFLLVCNGFTSTFGSTFIGVTLMSLGFSLVTVDSSAIPFLFADFFNYILTKNFDVYYYSFFLKNDIIILTFWIVLTLFFGIMTYLSWRNTNSKKRKELVEPIHITMENLTPPENNIEINVFTNSVENFNVSTFTRPPPKYSSIENYPQFNSNSKPTAPTTDIEPPPYSGLK